MMDKKKRKSSYNRAGKETSRTVEGEKAKTYVDPAESKINKGLAGLAKAQKAASESQAEGVEKSKPGDADAADDLPDKPSKPAEGKSNPPPSGEPKRSDYPEGLVGQAAYSRALREYRKKKQ